MLPNEYLIIEERLKEILNRVAGAWKDMNFLIFNLDDLKHENVLLLIRTKNVEDKIKAITSRIDDFNVDLKVLEESISRSIMVLEIRAAEEEELLDQEKSSDRICNDHWSFDSDLYAEYSSSSYEPMKSDVDIAAMLKKQLLFSNLLNELSRRLLEE
ncbi:hypothetical protein HHI36_010784 [Cryptolaemus montrouzieri]|uniref:Uncharacterized protein n=1 Tax=Cryptolaemus montrouzieri TaxID=559131 RepID=A0ABD2MJZ1_9CUCU